MRALPALCATLRLRTASAAAAVSSCVILSSNSCASLYRSTDWASGRSRVQLGRSCVSEGNRWNICTSVPASLCVVSCICWHVPLVTAFAVLHTLRARRLVTATQMERTSAVSLSAVRSRAIASRRREARRILKCDGRHWNSSRQGHLREVRRGLCNESAARGERIRDRINRETWRFFIQVFVEASLRVARPNGKACIVCVASECIGVWSGGCAVAPLS